MVILSSPLLTLDVSDVESVCNLLKKHSTDWEATLKFLAEWAWASGYEINYDLIDHKMRAYYGE